MNIRWIKAKDMKNILEIEKQSFPEPWSRQDFDKVFENKNCVCRVCCDDNDEKVLGYLVYEYDKVSYNIINFAIEESCRRRGIGKALMQNLISHMENSAKGRVFASVSDRNLAAQLFLRKMGFRAERISRNFFGPEHHAYEFVLLRMSNIKQKDEMCRGA